jgi:hypothetical protein
MEIRTRQCQDSLVRCRRSQKRNETRKYRGQRNTVRTPLVEYRIIWWLCSDHCGRFHAHLSRGANAHIEERERKEAAMHNDAHK